MDLTMNLFEEHKVMIRISGTKKRIDSFEHGKALFLSYVDEFKLTDSDLAKKDGHIYVGSELIAVISANGKVWSADDESEIKLEIEE